jgi:hypothetical protein
MMAFALAAGPYAAEAQTYDLDIVMGSFAPFVGSFTYSGGVLSHVDVSDGFDGGTFTGASSNGHSFSLIDYEGQPPNPLSSEVFTLGFTATLGGPATNVPISNIVLTISPQAQFYCGTSPTGSGSLPCYTDSLVKASAASAPELGTAPLASSITLLFGGLFVLGSRRMARGRSVG